MSIAYHILLIKKGVCLDFAVLVGSCLSHFVHVVMLLC